jgi:Cu/Ag efflux protein CusF
MTELTVENGKGRWPMTRKMIHLGSVLIVAALLAALAPTARAQALQPCSIAAIDARTGVVSAKVNASGAAFQFRVTDAALLKSLKVGQEVYANFTTRQVSLDDKRILGEIISPPQAAAPPAASMTAPKPVSPPPVRAPVAQPALGASVAAAPPPPVRAPVAQPALGAPVAAAPPPPVRAPVGKPALGAPAAAAPVTAPKIAPPPPASAPVAKPAPGAPAAAAPVTAPKIAPAPPASAPVAKSALGAPAAAPIAAGEIRNKIAPAAPSCKINAIDTNAGVVTATENATGKSFQFKVADSALLNSLKIDQGVYANFAAGVVSLDGITPNGPILGTASTSSAASAATGPSGGMQNTVGPVRSAAAQPAPASTPSGRPLAKETSLLSPVTAPKIAPPPPASAPVAKPAPMLAGAIPPEVYLHGSVSLAQARVLGGRSVSGTVTLNGQPAGEPVIITLKSSDPAATVVPSQISVPAGEMTSQFTVNTTPVAADPDSPEGIPVSIAASTTTGGALAPTNLRVMTPTLVGLGLSEGGQPVAQGPLGFKSGCTGTGTPQFQVVGRYPITACVKLNGPAPKGGITIPVANDYANLLGTNFPASVTIPEGSGSAAFTFSTAKVSTPMPIHISASRSPRNYKDATLTLEPPPTLTSVYFDLSSQGLVSNYPTVITTDGYESFVNAYLTFSFPPDTSQGDPGTADLSLSGGGGLGYPGTPCQYQSCPYTLTVSVAGSSSVLVVAGLRYVKKLNYSSAYPYYYYSTTATLTATYRGTTLSATYNYSQ